MAKVYLVGVGCGDPGLVSLRAQALIEQADCVLYDHLLDERLLDACSCSCRKIYVGKKGHGLSTSQQTIHEWLEQLAQESSCIVRLKGGDPYVFGRGGEEGEFLYEKGIPFEVVPGISSCIAGLSYAGIPITYRGLSRGFRVYTAYTKEKKRNDLPFDELANTNDTVVFLMGRSSLPEIVHEYLKRGSDRPIALISNATCFDQRVVSGRMSTILTQDLESITAPLLIVVGDVVQKRQALDWFSRQELSGLSIFYPRLSSRLELASTLQELGAQVDAPIAFEQCPHFENMQDIDLVDYDWIVLTSPSAIRFFMEWMSNKNIDVRRLPKLAVVGQKSAQVLQEYGLYADCIGEGNVDSLKKRLPASKILIPHSASNLEGVKGFRGQEKIVVLYSNKKKPIQPRASLYDVAICTSKAAVDVLKTHKINARYYIAIGPQSEKALLARGYSNVSCAKEASYESIVEAVKGVKRKKCIEEED